MNVVGYCRVSTESQKDEGTIELQERAIREYCDRLGYKLIQTFKDEGVSGTLKTRPALSEMYSFLSDVAGIGGVVIYKLDRLARDMLVQEHIMGELARLSVDLISLHEPDLNGDDPTRKFMRRIVGGIAELERDFIRMRLSDGRRNKAMKGGYAGGGVPLGYLVTPDGDLAIDGANATTVQLIFKLRRKKLSLHEIAKRLNELDIATARGGKWYARTVKYVLDNQLYRGRLTYTDATSQRPDLVLTGRGQIRHV